MFIKLYQEHLAEDLNRVKNLKEQSVQSYAVTTAVLLRKIIHHLDIDSLTIPNIRDKEKPYDLKHVLDIFIHYASFYPQWTFDDEETNYIALESDRYNRERSDTGLRFDIADYFKIVSKFAHDEAFLFFHLLKRTITCLYEVVKQPDKDFSPSLFDGIV